MSYRGALWSKWILPALGRMAIGAVEPRATSRPCTTGCATFPYRANQVLAILNRMFSLAEVMGLAAGRNVHPCRSIRKYREYHRERFLSEEEFRRLGRVLDEVEAESRDKGGVSVRASAGRWRRRSVC